MKTNLAIIIFTLCVFGCKNNSKPDHQFNDSLKADSVATSIPIIKDTSIVDTPVSNHDEIYHTDSINFEKFVLDAESSSVKAPIDWSSYPKAKDFKTRITEAYKSNEVSFAGNYVLATFGCGTSCIMGFMIDVRDGKIYDLPLGEENSCLFAEDRAICKTNSLLFISSICKEKLESRKAYYIAYLWDEHKKEFSSLKNEEEFLKNK